MDKRKILLILLALLLALSGCSGKEGKTSTQSVDYASQIREALFTQDTELNRAVDKAAQLKVNQVEETSITVTVTAPDVCDEVLSWFEGISDEDFTEDALNDKLLSLLEGKKITAQFTLELRDGKILYTDEFLNAASCGIRRFYTTLEMMFAEQLKEGVYD